MTTLTIKQESSTYFLEEFALNLHDLQGCEKYVSSVDLLKVDSFYIKKNDRFIPEKVVFEYNDFLRYKRDEVKQSVTFLVTERDDISLKLTRVI